MSSEHPRIGVYPRESIDPTSLTCRPRPPIGAMRHWGRSCRFCPRTSPPARRGRRYGASPSSTAICIGPPVLLSDGSEGRTTCGDYADALHRLFFNDLPGRRRKRGCMVRCSLLHGTPSIVFLSQLDNSPAVHHAKATHPSHIHALLDVRRNHSSPA